MKKMKNEKMNKMKKKAKKGEKQKYIYIYIYIMKRKKTKRTGKKERRKKKATKSQRPSTPAYTHKATHTQGRHLCRTVKPSPSKNYWKSQDKKLRHALLAYNHPVRHGNLHFLSRDSK